MIYFTLREKEARLTDVGQCSSPDVRRIRKVEITVLGNQRVPGVKPQASDSVEAR